MFSGLYNGLTLYVQYSKNQTVKKWLPFEPICAIYFEYIVTIHFVRPYPNLLTLYVQYTKTLPVKKWLPFELICAVYIVTFNSSPLVTCNQSEYGKERKMHPAQPCFAWLGRVHNKFSLNRPGHPHMSANYDAMSVFGSFCVFLLSARTQNDMDQRLIVKECIGKIATKKNPIIPQDNNFCISNPSYCQLCIVGS